jgi:hypothetical protein
MGKSSTPGQQQIAGSQHQFMDTLQSDFGTAFSGQQNIISGLTKSLQTTLAAGPSQYGFSAPQTTALDTLATTQNATNYAQAKAAAAQASAAAGGSSILPTGAAAGTQAQIASNAANAQSNAILGIQEKGYEQGNANYQSAVKNLQGTAGLENPSGLAGEANTAGNDAFGSATTLFKQELAANPLPQVGGLVGSLAGAAVNAFAPGVGSILTSGLSGSGTTGSLNSQFQSAQNSATPGYEPPSGFGDNSIYQGLGGDPSSSFGSLPFGS